MKKKLTDDEFFDALTNLLLAEGIKGMTVGEIAARMHCSRRRLYDIAQTKEEIFCAAVKHFFDGILAQGEALIIEHLRTMHGRTVVPDDEVIWAPRVAVQERLLRCVLCQLGQQEATLRDRHVDDMRRMRGKIQRFSAAARYGAHEGVHGAVELGPLLGRELETQQAT